jgi:hypothetical protein
MMSDAIGEQPLRCVAALLAFRPALFAVHVPVAWSDPEEVAGHPIGRSRRKDESAKQRSMPSP